MGRVALLANPDSGSGGSEEVERALASLGAEVSRFAIEDADAAIDADVERIVVAGGDGSVGCAAAVAARAGVPLAVVPVGTANDFARVFELPDELGPACELAVSGERTRTIEIARMGERAFVNVASVGLPPAAARRAHGLKRHLGPLAYAVGAVRAGLTIKPTWCRIAAADGAELYAGEVWQATIACSGAFGGGSRVKADPGDGLLDAVVVEASSRMRLIARARGMRSGSLEEQAGVYKSASPSFTLDLEPETAVNVDGEVCVHSGAVELRAEPAAVDLVVA